MSVWLEEGDEVIITALDILKKNEEAARRKNGGRMSG